MQDRIVGPLTMVQFIYAVIGGGLCYLIYSKIPAPVSYLLISPVALFVVCLDLVKINERPFWEFFTAAIGFMVAPKRRFWQQGEDSNLSVEIYKSASTATQAPPTKNFSKEEMDAVAGRLDTAEAGKYVIRN